MSTNEGEGQFDIFPNDVDVPPTSGSVAPAQVSDEVREICGRLPDSIRIGASSWSFPGWAGLVYAGYATKAQLARSGLAAYAAHPALRTVSLDRTWHAPIAVHDYERYGAQVSDGFRLLVKAHSLCTAPLAWDGDGTNPNFLDPAYAAEVVVRPFVEGLRAKGGPLLFQFSPMSRRQLERAGVCGPRAFAERLEPFLAALPKGPLYAVELRNRELFTPRYLRALESAGVRHCLCVHPRMTPLDVQLDAVGSAMAPRGATVVRWNLNPDFDYETAKRRYRPFDRIQDPQPRLRALIARACRQTHERGDETYVIINNKAEGSGPLSAIAMIEAIVNPPGETGSV